MSARYIQKMVPLALRDEIFNVEDQGRRRDLLDLVGRVAAFEAAVR